MRVEYKPGLHESVQEISLVGGAWVTTHRASSTRSSYTLSIFGGGLSPNNGHIDYNIYDNLLNITVRSTLHKIVLPKPSMNFRPKKTMPGAVPEEVVVYRLGEAEEGSSE